MMMSPIQGAINQGREDEQIGVSEKRQKVALRFGAHCFRLEAALASNTA
jgi:hypothetical protein